jgi:hypothetical protein
MFGNVIIVALLVTVRARRPRATRAFEQKVAAKTARLLCRSLSNGSQ